MITPANESDKSGLVKILNLDNLENLEKIWADSGYQGEELKDLSAMNEIDLEIIKRSHTGFKILPRRWVVERTFAWLFQNRRLVKDYEESSWTSMAWIWAAQFKTLLRRSAKLI